MNLHQFLRIKVNQKLSFHQRLTLTIRLGLYLMKLFYTQLQSHIAAVTNFILLKLGCTNTGTDINASFNLMNNSFASLVKINSLGFFKKSQRSSQMPIYLLNCLSVFGIGKFAK